MFQSDLSLNSYRALDKNMYVDYAFLDQSYNNSVGVVLFYGVAASECVANPWKYRHSNMYCIITRHI